MKRYLWLAVALFGAYLAVVMFAPLRPAHAQEGALQTNRTVNISQVGGNTVGASLPVSVANTAGSTDPCQNPAVLKSSAKIQLTTTTAAALVALASGKTVYVCGFAATIQGSATTVGTLQFEYGTQTTNPCDTGATTLTGAFAGNITANVPTAIESPGGYTLFSSAASNQLCAVATGTTISVQGYITYVQQ